MIGCQEWGSNSVSHFRNTVLTFDCHIQYTINHNSAFVASQRKVEITNAYCWWL